MRSLRNRTVTVVLTAVLVIGLAIGLATASWQVITVTCAVVIVGWLTWVSRRVHITASEVRRLGSAAVATSDQVERLGATSTRVHERLDEALQELRDERAHVDREVVSAIDSLRKDLTAEDGATERDVLQAIDEVRDEVREVRRQSNELAASTRLSAERDAVESLVERFGTTSAQVDKTKRQLNRVVRRQVEMYGMFEILEAALTSRVDQFLDEFRWELRKSRQDMSQLSRRVEESEPGRADVAIHQYAMERSGFDLQKYLYYLSYHVPREVEAQQQLQSTFRPEGLRPLLGGWALTPSGMLDIAQAISRDSPDVVVECGSGTSTMWIALALRDSGGGHVFALEHEPAFAEETRRQLSSQGLSEYATVVDALIVEQNGANEIVEWYDVSRIGEIDRIDILVVDGPPQVLGDLRKYAIELLSDRFADGTRVFADDVNRDAERTMVTEWIKEFPSLQKRVSSTPVQSHLVWNTAEST